MTLPLSSLILTGLLTLPCVAVEPAIMERVRREYTGTTSMEASFDLAVYWQVRDKEDHTTGRIVVAPGNKFRVEVDKTTWVSDGETCWQYNSASRQVIVNRLGAIDASSQPSQILSSYLRDRRYQQTEENGGIVVVESRGDSTQARPRTITVWIDKSTARVSSLRITDATGNRSTYTFRKTRFGITVPKETFTFAAPRDAQVLDMR